LKKITGKLVIGFIISPSARDVLEQRNERENTMKTIKRGVALGVACKWKMLRGEAAQAKEVTE